MTVPPGGVPLVTFKGVDMMLVLANFVLDSLEGAILLSRFFWRRWRLVFCLRPHRAEALSDAFVWRLSVFQGYLKGQKVKSQLVADVLNSQHPGTGATWRINAKLLSTGAEAYCVVTRTACYKMGSCRVYCKFFCVRHCCRGLACQANCAQFWLHSIATGSVALYIYL